MSSSVSTNNRSSSSNGFREVYIYNLPPEDLNDLCAILDDSDVWSILAKDYMNYPDTDLKAFKRAATTSGCSPSNELLTNWGNYNHTVTELFALLHRMQQYNAMDAIKSSVDPKYHYLITHNLPDLSNLMHKSRLSKKILNCNESTSDFSNSNNESSIVSERGSNNKKRYDKEAASTIPKIDYQELLEATNNWNEENKLGSGGFGTVYKGTWKLTRVAIKRVTYQSSDGGDDVQLQQILNELQHLNSCRHVNVLPLYGYSTNGANPCLVYQLMPGGSLEGRLKSRSEEPLSWIQRLNIACGTARGLQFLHTCRDKPLIHGDIKPANILLDSCNEPIIGDFGLAREGRSQNTYMEVSRVFGTRPYLPEEWIDHRKLSTKVDTFSYGVMLLEMFTGWRVSDSKRVKALLSKYIPYLLSMNVQIEEMIDKNLLINAHVKELCQHVINVGISCISEDPEHRPQMVKVLLDLENLQTQFVPI